MEELEAGLDEICIGDIVKNLSGLQIERLLRDGQVQHGTSEEGDS